MTKYDLSNYFITLLAIAISLAEALPREMEKANVDNQTEINIGMHSQEGEVQMEKGSCSPNQFLCTEDQACIPENYKCDGDQDCPLGSDEKDCLALNKTCKPSEFQCTENFKCIPAFYKCDNDNDCPKGTDELNCPAKTCAWDEFQCSETLKCIRRRFKCDGEKDCLDGSDEMGCYVFDNSNSGSPFRKTNSHADYGDIRGHNMSCGENEFWCFENSTCIPSRFVCNQHKDCASGSDENSCPVVNLGYFPANGSCDAGDFRCSEDDICFKGFDVCDGVYDCPTGSDELDCLSDRSCNSEQFRCFDNSSCIPKVYKCDDDKDCSDGSDEVDCHLSFSEEASSSITVNSNRPENFDQAPSETKQDQTIISSVEHGGNNVNERPCNDNEFRCSENVYCLPVRFKCDGDTDCSDGSDELGCDWAVASGRDHNSACIHPTPTGCIIIILSSLRIIIRNLFRI